LPDIFWTEYYTHAFKLLADHNLIPNELARSLQKMVGFRNIAVHSYQELDQAVLSFVVEKGFNDFIEFCKSLGVKISKFINYLIF